jgi:sugar (pentulose or hexulose) kinase
MMGLGEKLEDDRHDYVVWKLCGVCVTDSTTASTTGLTDLSFKVAIVH